jgi:hypothetical protein
VKLPLCTFTPWLTTLSLELIDSPLKDRPIRKEGFQKPLHLVKELKEGLPKPAEFFSCCPALYAHIYNSIQIMKQKARKK